MDYTFKNWSDIIEKSDLSQKLKEERLFVVRQSFQNNVPVIIDPKHLSLLLGVKFGVLTAMVNKPSSFYRNFQIPKRKGGIREIVTPYKSLLETQQWINLHILSQFRVHPAAFAYVKKKNIAQNAYRHIGREEMLKMDLVDFFPTIKIPRVRELFKRLGYSKEVTNYLSQLCCLNGSLPQGAASSPLISNIILNTLDKRLSAFARKKNLIYTRYADDIAFSGKSIPPDFQALVGMTVNDEGFTINSQKTKFYKKYQRKILTGVVVKEDSLTLPKPKRREIKQQVHYILTYGIMDQVEYNKDIYYIDRVLGRLSYWKQIEPENAFVINSLSSISLMYSNVLKDLS
ncbi:retron St85 family RNA-directed DNA polymerase [Gillisia sp. Q332]|uniref:retron St85 family RNA-directed DNA polymerase n=1 Tax=Gillisia xinjiangensis TaxID=3384765 RepID=UPI00391BF6A7